MLHLKENLKIELSRSIVDFWINTPAKYCEVVNLVIDHGTWNATTVMLEETWLLSENLVDKTFLYLIQALFPYLRAILEEEFEVFTRTGEVAYV
jgi:hypothetical protein